MLQSRKKPKQTTVSVVCLYLKELTVSQDFQDITSWNSECKDTSQPGSLIEILEGVACSEP